MGQGTLITGDGTADSMRHIESRKRQNGKAAMGVTVGMEGHQRSPARDGEGWGTGRGFPDGVSASGRVPPCVSVTDEEGGFQHHLDIDVRVLVPGGGRHIVIYR
jgi:hypothetical protein